MVASSPQYGEKRGFFPRFPADGFYGWGILLLIPLEFFENKASTISYDTAQIDSYILGNTKPFL